MKLEDIGVMSFDENIEVMSFEFILIPVAGCVGCTVTTTITTANTDRLRPSSVLTGSVITASTVVAGTVVKCRPWQCHS